MVEMGMGLLFKKVNYKGDDLEVFEYIDVVCGIDFTNTDNKRLFHITSGDYELEYADTITNTKPDSNLLVITHDCLDLFKEYCNTRIRFGDLKNKMRDLADGKYYIKTNSGVTELMDSNIIDLINREKQKKEFDEQELKNDTDISTMYNNIKKTIISQDEQIMKILTALFKNQKVVNSNFDNDMVAKLKENIIIYGSTGTGKTEILKRIAKIYNVPIIIEDATSLSETGYHGRNVTDMLENLILAANNDIELAERGILVIDEFDKLAEKDATQSHVSREGVQRALLKILDGSPIYFNDQKFDTSKLTIVGVGAFTGITKGDNYQDLTTDDFMKYGIKREVIARFSKTIPMNPLSKLDIEKILLNSDFSPLKTYEKLFEEMKIKFNYNKEFVSWLAEEAVKKNSGARSLKTVFDNCISSAMFRIFAGEYEAITMIKPEPPENKPYVLTKKNEKKKFFKR